MFSMHNQSIPRSASFIIFLVINPKTKKKNLKANYYTENLHLKTWKLLTYKTTHHNNSLTMEFENPKKKKKKSKETPLTHNWFCQANHNNNDNNIERGGMQKRRKF